MAANGLWRCLRTPHYYHPVSLCSPRTQLQKQRVAAFTTTISLSGKPVKAKGPPPSTKALLAKQKTQSNKVRIKKKVVIAAKPAYEEGERKMLRCRIVLSNPNAIPVELPEMTGDLAGNLDTAGSVFALTDTVLEKLRALEVFETKQHWPFFHRPSTLIRTETALIGVLLNNVDNTLEGDQLHLRCIVDGYYGSGRSILLLQAMAWALQKNWVVISIPNAMDLVIGHTEYELDPTSNLWLQRVYTCDLLKRVLKANQKALGEFKLSRAYRLGRQDEVPGGTSLKEVVQVGAWDPMSSWDAFNALLSELSLPSSPPVLFTLDNLGQISLPSQYRDPAYKPIHAHDLALPNTFLSFLSGKRSFNRGVTIAATSSKCGRTTALDLALRHAEISPFEDIDPRIAESIKGAKVIEVEKLNKKEAKSLMDYYNQSGILKDPVTIDTFSEKYALSAGNPRDLFASCLRVRV